VVHDLRTGQSAAARLRIGHVAADHLDRQAVDAGGVLAHQRAYPPPLRKQAAHQIGTYVARSSCDSYEPPGIVLFVH
jgi:hypothetical protein